ncbi:MAG: hypothetical protein A2378_04005 [Candidatus Pacebacteria bacterium RIFOXYB1_FULL_44_10]|nr:MAG: hypothetical protein A2378_04005 [Candidatus Pacebacteria bacterium RIFOXYB1_FULL_44_10]
MANHTWTYLTTTITFTNPAHLKEDSPELLLLDVHGRAYGGTPFSDNRGDSILTYPFTAFIWKDHATELDFTDMLAFFELIKGGKQFTWVDSDSVSRTAIMVTPNIKFASNTPYWVISVNLEVIN